jgi:hypothetical protein
VGILAAGLVENGVSVLFAFQKSHQQVRHVLSGISGRSMDRKLLSMTGGISIPSWLIIMLRKWKH